MHRILLELTRRYGEPGRHYHTIQHVADMLHTGRDLDLSDAQVLAIWFHDAVYDVQSSTNEEDSAALAETLLCGEGYPRAGVDVVRRIVLDTKRHEPSIEESAKVIDLDLAPLAIPWDAYRRNSTRIRREYAWLSDEDFAAGQRDFLRRFLARERIYWTEWGRGREAAARENMQGLLDLLGPD